MLISIIIALVILGIGLYLLNLIPMDATIKQIIRVVVILFAVLYALSAFFPAYFTGVHVR